jgi:hypothetical protein
MGDGYLVNSPRLAPEPGSRIMHGGRVILRVRFVPFTEWFARRIIPIGKNRILMIKMTRTMKLFALMGG